MGKDIFQIEEFNIISINKFEFESNIRKRYDDENLNELVESLKKYGQIQPICSYKKNNKLNILYGHRRYLAAQKAGIKQIVSIIIAEPSEKDKIYIQATENEQSESISCEDRELYIKRLRDMGESFEVIAKKIGKSESWVRECSIAANIRLKNSESFEKLNTPLSTKEMYCFRNATKEQIDEAIEMALEKPELKDPILKKLNSETKRKNSGKNVKNKLSNYPQLIIGKIHNKKNDTFSIIIEKNEIIKKEQETILIEFINDLLKNPNN